jgi:hypothetical protein
MTGEPAVFARSARPRQRDLVFTAGYLNLPGILARGGALSNAVVVASERDDANADIELVSNATHGTSGAPVLSSAGLVIGVVTHKLRPDRVLATNGGNTKAFLAANNIRFEEDDRPQLAAFQDRAKRAASVSVGVTCFK